MVETPQPATKFPGTKSPPVAAALSRRQFLRRGVVVGGLLIVTPAAVLSPDRA